MPPKFMSIFMVILLAAGAAVAGAAEEASAVRVEPMSVERFDSMVRGESARYAVVVMAAWCTPCRKELPSLIRLHDEYEDKGLRLIGMSVDYGGVKVIQKLVDRYEVDFPVYWVGEAALEEYGIKAIPQMLFFREGRITDRLVGAHTPEQLEERLSKFIASP